MRYMDFPTKPGEVLSRGSAARLRADVREALTHAWDGRYDAFLAALAAIKEHAPQVAMYLRAGIGYEREGWDRFARRRERTLRKLSAAGFAPAANALARHREYLGKTR